ncbi:nuclear transport factor 2 family protein [Pseudogemmobacter bohemicus]|uniref:nuclear transport factor 2 family protein n=1 Tax=Pseudogemmobacter bohemicus TaxID=2250708 RepID=UPI001E332A2A|nr:nuclear transport factor 2 family protein [Pseudogemmobacter bohemicus]
MAITPDTHILLADLIHRFWAVIDEQSDSPGPDFFTPDGTLVIGSFEARGRDALIRYFAERHPPSLQQPAPRRLRRGPRIGPDHHHGVLGLWRLADTAGCPVDTVRFQV